MQPRRKTENPELRSRITLPTLATTQRSKAFTRVAVLLGTLAAVGCGTRSGLEDDETDAAVSRPDARADSQRSDTQRPDTRIQDARVDTGTDSRVPDAGHDSGSDSEITDSPADTANDQGDSSDATDASRCSPTATCDLLTRSPPRDYSAPCSTGVIAVTQVGPPVTCASIMFPPFGPIVLSFEGVELHGSRENVIFDMYVSGCTSVRRDREFLDRLRTLEYTIASGTHSFNFLSTRPATLEYPGSGAEEVLMQVWASGCGTDFLRPPVLTASVCAGREYDTITVPLSEVNGRLKVGPYNVQVREITESVSEPHGTTCEVSNKQVRLEIEAPGERFEYTLSEAESVWQILSGDRCVYAGVGSINLYRGAPSSPGPGSPSTCPISD